MTRMSSMPAPKNKVSEIAMAVSMRIFEAREMALVKSTAIVPITTAPTMRAIMLRPSAPNTITVVRNASSAPGRAE